MALHEQSMPDGAAPGDVSLESQERDRQAVELRTKQAKKGNKIARSIEVAPSGATENPIESVPATLEVAGDVAVAAPADATELTSAAPVATTNAVCGLALQTLDRIGTDLTKRLVECAPTKTSKLQTERCLKELRSMVQELGPGWDVTQFGSAANGFNTVHSDLDITCFVPREKQSVTTQLDATSELRDRVLPLVRQHQDFEVVGEIFGAKVPILKLRFEKELDVDLSCHNLQPLVNTRLLKAYSVMDRNKVGSIGIAVKLWSKAAAVCGSAKGSLSSYAFMLMMLYFMQVHEDVMMPVLAPEAFLQDGRENTDTSANAFKACWRTDLTVVDLLVRFFCFYANQFIWGSEVASVRVGARHMASEPMYSKLRARQAHRLHIEDPYEVDRNLHAYVDEKNLRELFAQALRDLEVGQVPIGLVPLSAEPEGDADALQAPASKAKCDAETTSTRGASAVGTVREEDMFEAAKRGNAERMARHGANVNAKDKRGESLLHHGARCGHEKVVKELGAAGADVNAKDPKHRTPLHVAAKDGQVECLKALVQLRADINAKAKRMVIGRMTFSELTPMHIAAAGGHADAVRACYAAGANFNVKDWSDSTPLHLAAFEGKLESLKALVQMRANINAKNRFGVTPMDLAKNEETKGVLRTLGAR